MLLKIASEIKKSNYIRSVLILVGGTAGAQAIMILVLPLLTRLYTPDDFSILAVYAAILGIGSVSACLRLDIAIPMPESDSVAANLLSLAFLSCTTIALLTALLVFIAPIEIVNIINQPRLLDYLWLLPIGIFFSGTYNALQYWSTRKKRFTTIATSRMEQSIAGASTQVGFGFFAVAPLGLIVGQIFSSGGGIVRLLRSTLSQDREALSSITLRKMHDAFKTYENFPKYSSFEALANTIGIQLPIIIIASLSIGPEAGCLMLAMKILQAPLGLLGSAIAQVYLARGPAEHREGNLAEFTSQTVNNLLKTGAGPLIFCGIMAPQVFALVFGDEWHRAGILAAWMTPWIVIQFISSPISMVMHITNKQRRMLGLTLTGLSIRVGCILIAIQLSSAFVSEVYAVTGAVFYGICFKLFTKQAGFERSHYVSAIKSAYPIVIGWALLGVLASFILQRIIQ
ncbi:hypothetical protein D3C75_540430 [compost metagenome]|jgi:O-antigen/teichoic acid export membrane protein